MAAVKGVSAATALLMAFFLASRSVGFVRQAVITALFGVGPEADAWFAAFRLPDTLFTLFAGGALVSAVIPVYTEIRARGDKDERNRFVSGLLNLAGLALILGGGAGALLARPLTDLLVPGFDEPTRALTATATRWLMLSPLLLGLSAVAKGILQSERRFLLPALGPLLYGIGTILGGLLLAAKHGILGLVWGTVGGAFAQLAVQAPGMAREGVSYVFLSGFRHPGIRKVVTLMLPRLVGFAVIQVSFFFVNFLASYIGPASVSALSNAWLLLLFPLGVIAIPFAEASLPAFSSLWVLGDRRALSEQCHWALRRVLFLLVPACVGLALLAGPLISVLFERRAFGAEATRLTSYALVFYAAGLVGHGAVEVLARAFYSMHDTKTPVVIGACSLVLQMIASWALSLVMGIGGLALGVSLGALFEAAVLYAVLGRRLEIGAQARRALRSLAGVLAGAGAMGAGLYALVRATWTEGGSTWSNAGLLAAYLAVGAAAFLLVAWIARSEELAVSVARVREKLSI